MRIVAVLIALTMLGGVDLIGQARTAAQESPDPSECQVEPRDDAWIADLLATPVAVVVSPVPFPATPVPAESLPGGEPAGPEVLFGINETLRELVACFNAGDIPRGLALFTDDVSPDTVIFFGFYDPGEPMSATTPVPLPEEQRLPFFSIRDPRVLEDGRVGAIVSNDAAPEASIFVIFVEQDGRWLIDEAFETDAGGAAGP